MTDLRAQLQNTLGEGYTFERELGGGGMSRVFVAHENALGRTVVVKVIAPELAEGVSAERFAREVKLAARLQQANIVPVLRTGSSGSLPYYTMPFVAGESLRARLANGVPLTISQSLWLLSRRWVLMWISAPTFTREGCWRTNCSRAPIPFRARRTRRR